MRSNAAASRNCQVDAKKLGRARARIELRRREPPIASGSRTQDAHEATAVEVAFSSEVVGDGCVGGEKSLGGTAGLEALELSLSAPDREMGVLGPVVISQTATAMNVPELQIAERSAV